MTGLGSLASLKCCFDERRGSWVEPRAAVGRLGVSEYGGSRSAAARARRRRTTLDDEVVSFYNSEVVLGFVVARTRRGRRSLVWVVSSSVRAWPRFGLLVVLAALGSGCWGGSWAWPGMWLPAVVETSSLGGHRAPWWCMRLRGGSMWWCWPILMVVSVGRGDAASFARWCDGGGVNQ